MTTRLTHIKILNSSGNVRCVAPNFADGVLLTAMKRTEQLMANDTLNVTITSRTMIDFSCGDYCTIDGERYCINQLPDIRKSGDSLYTYNLVFESVKYDLANVIFLLPDSTLDDYLTANLNTLLQLVCDNANRVYGNNVWSYHNTIANTDICTEQFTEMNCLAALQKIVEMYDGIFRVTTNGDNKVINVSLEGSAQSLTLSYGHKGGLYEIHRTAVNNENVITRLYVYGSQENIPTGYPHARLCLPYNGTNTVVNRRNTSFVQDNSAIARYGVKEGIAICDTIKPHATFEVSQVISTNKFKCNALNVSAQYGFKIDANWGADDYPEYLQMRGYADSQDVEDYFLSQHVQGTHKYLVDGACDITFNTGKLAGRSFKVKNNGVSADGSEIELLPYTENADDIQFERTFPDDSTFAIEVGDEFVISNIMLPYKLVQRAEGELQTEANRLLAEKSGVSARYDVKFDTISIDGIDVSMLVCGDNIRLVDTELLGDKRLRIDTREIDFLNGTVAITISNFARVYHSSRINDGGEVYEDIDGMDEGTMLTCQFAPNYGGNYNQLHVSAGTFTNKSLLGRRKTWELYDRVLTLESDQRYNLYVKASKATTYSSIVMYADNSAEADVIGGYGGLTAPHIGSLSSSSIDTNSVYLYIGYITSARMLRSGSKVRSMSLIYGTNTTSANEIDGGTIYTPNGDEVLDIDSGEIGNGALVDVGSQQPVSLPSHMRASRTTINGNSDTQVAFDKEVSTALEKMHKVMRNNFGALSNLVEGFEYSQKVDGEDVEDKTLEPTAPNSLPHI